MSHKCEVDMDRYRVRCTQCPWFSVHLGWTIEQLRGLGRQHQNNARQFQDEQ